MDKINVNSIKRLMAYQIRMCRMMRGYTQQDIANQLQKSLNAVSSWELGKTSPSPDDMVRLCNILDITPNQLCGWDKNPELDKYISSHTATESDLIELRRQKKEIEQKIRIYNEILNRRPK